MISTITNPRDSDGRKALRVSHTINLLGVCGCVFLCVVGGGSGDETRNNTSSPPAKSQKYSPTPRDLEPIRLSKRDPENHLYRELGF